MKVNQQDLEAAADLLERVSEIYNRTTAGAAQEPWTANQLRDYAVRIGKTIEEFNPEAHPRVHGFEPDPDGGIEWNVLVCGTCDELYPCRALREGRHV